MQRICYYLKGSLKELNLSIRIKVSILPQQEIDSMLDLVNQMEDNKKLQYAKLQKAIIQDSRTMQKTQEIIEQVIINYEEQLHHTIPSLLEKCVNLKRLDLGKMQAKKIKLIEDALEVVKEDNQNILSKAIELRAQQALNVH